jgi:hypothetical protein
LSSGSHCPAPLSSKPPQCSTEQKAQGDTGCDRDKVAPALAPACCFVRDPATAQPDQDRPQQADHDESKHQGDDEARHVNSAPSPRQTAEIKHASTWCNFEIKHVGVGDIETHVSLRLHDEDITFEWTPTESFIERRVARLTE